MRKLLNAFSLSMVEPGSTIKTKTLSLESVKFMAVPHRCGFDSCIGHADTAKILSDLLGQEIKANRKNILLQNGESAVVAQYKGPRLPEGTISLPEGATIEFILISVIGPSQEIDEPLPDSIRDGIMKFARNKIASKIQNPHIRPMQDGYGNFFAQVTGLGFYAEITDE